MPITQENNARKYNALVIVTSDTCSKDASQDESGPFVVEQLYDTELFKRVDKIITSDDFDAISDCIEKSIESIDPALIITVGGTGLCPRDVTPEATSSLYDKICSGIMTALHMTSLRYVPHAALSRLTSGIISGTLVVNFPGKLKACRDCFACLAVILEHALEQVRYDYESYSATHRRQTRQGNVTKQFLRSPSGKTIELAMSTSSLSSNGGSVSSKPTKNRFYKNQQQRSRSSSEVSKHKLSIQAIAESREETLNLEQEQLLHGPRALIRPVKQPSVPKQLNSKQPAKHPNQQKANKPQPPPKPTAQQMLGFQQETTVPLPLVKILKSDSPYPLVEFNECLRILADTSANLFKEPQVITLSNFSKAYSAVGATLAEDLVPKRKVPPYAVSMMDGYVLKVNPQLQNAMQQVKSRKQVPLVASLETFEAMQKDHNFEEKSFCYQVNTGGRLPKYGFAVIPAEKATRDGDMVDIHDIKQGCYVRSAGCDIDDKDVIKQGTIIGPVELSTIIAMGHKTFKVLPRPRIGLLSTGDEVEDFFSNEFINQDSVADVNSPLLQAMFRSKGYHTIFGGVAKDDPNEVLRKISDLLNKCDVVLVTGGASMGSKDHVKDVIKHMGGAIHFGRVNMKPGKPVAFASLPINDKRKFIFSLPGNPVSAFITSLTLVLPFLKHGAERYLQLPKTIIQHIGERIFAEIESITDSVRPYHFESRLEFIRAKTLSMKRKFVDSYPYPVYGVEVSAKQHSSRLLNLVNCDCLIMVDPSKKGKILEVGHSYPAMKLNLRF